MECKGGNSPTKFFGKLEKVPKSFLEGGIGPKIVLGVRISPETKGIRLLPSWSITYLLL